MTRGALLLRLVQAVEEVQRPHPIRVAVDGPDAAGKTTLADELAGVLAGRGRTVIRASLDDFHRPRAERYRQGEDSPEGYYEDAFDYRTLTQALLRPLGPGGDRAIRTAIYDYRTDAEAPAPRSSTVEDAVLLFDGVFLLRPELAGHWDLRIFVSVDLDEALRRALRRDLALFGSASEVERRYRTRYVPAQRLYLAKTRPLDAADVIVFNDDPADPRLAIRRAS